jgi:nitrite reductase/ring-hydroxylating ferredoxin subunit
MPHAEIPLADIPLNIPVAVEQDNMKIVILRTESQISAFEDACPHAFWPLSEGTVRKGVLECPGHGWEFSAETGRCLNAPTYCLNPIAFEVVGETIRLQWHGSSPAGANS